MLDLGHLPTPGPADIQTFTLPSTVTNLQWHTWVKPRGKALLTIFCVGGGGGGGGGFSRATAAAGGGGGGGASSAFCSTLFRLSMLPDRLFIQVGAGGQGVGSGGGTAGSGVLSYVCVAPDTGVSNVLVVSGSAAPTGGGTGTGAAVGAASTAGAVGAGSDQPLGQALGIGRLAVAGQAGAAGGAVAGAIGPPATIPVTGSLTMGGGGGAGTTSADFVGSIITAISNSLISEQRPAGAAADNGSGGYVLGPPMGPWWSYCGLGGGSRNNLAGGAGGNGAYGSGGGGGGAGTTGGRGGDGGGGIVILTSW